MLNYTVMQVRKLTLKRAIDRCQLGFCLRQINIFHH